MRVDEIVTRKKYDADPRFARKKPSKLGTYAQMRGDNLPPAGNFEKEHQFALISRKFYYFGRSAIPIPFSELEKKGPGFKKCFDSDFVADFVQWLAKQKPGKQGEPCQSKQERSSRCKSSC